MTTSPEPFTPSRVCLVVVFNHRFEQNLPTLDALYRRRFSHVVYIMPFYGGDRPDVVPVFESSHRFQGYFAQARHRLCDDQFTHYVIIADDLLLNPALNETNVLDGLRLGMGNGYLKNLRSLPETPATWYHHLHVHRAFHGNGVHQDRELPDPEHVYRKFSALGVPFPHRCWGSHTLRDWDGSWLPFMKLATNRSALRLLPRLLRRRRLPYPLLMGYSDLVVVPADGIREFCRLCGVTAAMGLFVEIAIPTILAWTCQTVVTEEKTYSTAPVMVDEPKASRWKGLEMWDPASVDALMNRYHCSLARLLDGFPSEWLYVHPIKLSQWKMDGRANDR